MARYRDFTGFETPAHSVTSFLSTFKFSSLATAASARKSLSGVACAVLSRNLTVLRALSEAKADLDAAVLPLNDFDLWPGFTAVHVACQGGPRFEAILRELLELRADPRGTLHGHAPALSLCTSPGAVEILVDHRADVNQLQPTFLATPVQLIAGRGVPPPVLEKLIQLRADVNLSRGGTGMPVLSWLASFTGTSYARETLSLLVDAAADVNARVKMTGIIRKIELGSRFYAMFAGKKDFSGIYIYICMYIYIHIYICKMCRCICIHTRTNIHVNMYTYICMYEYATIYMHYMCKYMRLHVAYIVLHVYVYVYTCMPVHMYMYIHVYMCIYICVYMYMCADMYTCICIYVYMFVYIFIYVHVCIHMYAQRKRICERETSMYHVTCLPVSWKNTNFSGFSRLIHVENAGP